MRASGRAPVCGVCEHTGRRTALGAGAGVELSDQLISQMKEVEPGQVIHLPGVIKLITKSRSEIIPVSKMLRKGNRKVSPWCSWRCQSISFGAVVIH